MTVTSSNGEGGTTTESYKINDYFTKVGHGKTVTYSGVAQQGSGQGLSAGDALKAMGGVIAGQWKGVLRDTIQQTRDHNPVADLFVDISGAEEIVDGALSAIEGDYTNAAVSVAGAALSKLKLLRTVAKGTGYGPNDPPVRIEGDWSINDMKAALLGHPPKGLGKPDLHHADQMPGSAIHEILPELHRGNKSLHPNKFNQGVTPEMREADRKLHWWYRAREQGADDALPNWIYD